MSSFPATPQFRDRAAAYGINFDEGDLERLGQFLWLLIETNRRLNLTAITDPTVAWIRHVFDSLTLLPFFEQTRAARAVDIGSGGGLPGMALAIVLPHIAFTLVEATGKKAAFLAATVEALSLKNVCIINDRAETLARDRENHREHYDIATARAIGPMNVLLELASPFVRVGGLVLAIKGRRAAAEIEAAKSALRTLRCAVIASHRTPTGTIVAIEKLQTTPMLYPRRPGEPKKHPIA